MKKVRKSIVYQRCERITQFLAGLGYSVVDLKDLEWAIGKYIGGDPRTVRAYRKYLIKFDFLAPRGNYFLILKSAISAQKTLTEEAREK